MCWVAQEVSVSPWGLLRTTRSLHHAHNCVEILQPADRQADPRAGQTPGGHVSEQHLWLQLLWTDRVDSWTQPQTPLEPVGTGSSTCHTHLSTLLWQGKPKPQASWTHNGQALDSQRVSVRSGDQDSILFIRSAQRSDSGSYELTVRLEGLEAKAIIDILVIGTAEGEGATSQDSDFPLLP